MAQVTFNSLKLKPNNEVDTFDFMGKTIEVRRKIHTSDKVDLLMITLQKSQSNDIFNPILLDTFFHLNLVYLYTNITFTAKQREDELALFDLLEQNDFFESFLPLIADDYKELQEYLEVMVQHTLKYTHSAANVISKFVNDLPTNAEAAKSIVDSFNPEKYQAVLDFATAANGGRPLPEVQG